MPDVLTRTLSRRYIDEFAAGEYLGLTARTLQQWRRDGVGPAYVRVSSRCVRYDVQVLDAWMAARVRAHTTDPGPQAA